MQATLDRVDAVVLSIRGFEEQFAKLPSPPLSTDGTPLSDELAAARKGLRALRDEVAELSSSTAPPADAQRTEQDEALLELASMLQNIMSAAKT